MKFRIRFNKTRGNPGRGTKDHVWRVFAGKKEYLAKHVVINVPCRSEKECCSEDWNIVCNGEMQIDRETSTITIVDNTI
ncbi:hypothetical protein [Caudoviricetes sp.]|nr:hypothetical protein [Caudoviricetes sp.]